MVFAVRRRMLLGLGIGIFMLAMGIIHVVSTSPNQEVKRVKTAQRVVAITIDDGPDARTTPEILAVLRDKGVHATFFTLGKNAEKNLPLLAQVSAEGHEIGSHAYSHEFLNHVSDERLEEEITRAEQLIMKVAPKPMLFRPPGGGYNQHLVDKLAEHGYTTVMWSVDSRDWARPPVQTVVDHVLKSVKPGDILLFHDGQPNIPTAKALSIIIDRLREQGYQMVMVTELLLCQQFP